MVGTEQQTATPSVVPQFTTGYAEVYGGTKDGLEPWVGEELATNLNPKKVIHFTVNDMRSMPTPPNIHKQGHELIHHPTSITRDEFFTAPTPEGKKMIETKYYAEVKDLLLKKTGAANVIPFHFGFRVDYPNKRPDEAYAQFKNTNIRGVTDTLHVDKDPEIAKVQLRTALGEEKFEALLKKYKRVHIVNTWRPIGHVIERYPLLLIDTAEVPDFSYKNNFAYLEQRNTRGGYKSHQIILKSDDRYKYNYASKMTPDEVLIFRDCAVTGDFKGQPHGAFWDNSTREDAPGRESIEVRSVVVYDE